MNILDTMMKRRSYRGPFQSTPVPREDLKKIMEAGLSAPSGCNMQTTSVIAVDDPDLLAELFAIFDRPNVHTAPAMICVLTERLDSYRGRCYATQDYAAAIENMLLAIVELGYQSCWYEGYIDNEEKVGYQMAQLLQVPDGVDLVCCLPVGRPENEVTAGPMKKPFEERAWFNAYRRID